MSDSKKFLVVCLCLIMVVGTSFGQQIKVVQGSSPYIKGAKPMFATIPAAGLQAGEVPPAAQVPLWTGSFVFNQQTFNFTMVGTNPTQGSVTSKIPLVIVPIAFQFSDGTTLSAMQQVCGDTKTTVQRIKASPIVKKTANFSPGGTNVGTTQYIDAFQRANFWSTVSTTSPSYHVLFGPIQTKPLQTITVPAANGTTVAGPCARIGEVQINFYDSKVQALITSLGIPASSLPLFVSYNTFETSGGCCILGYHSVKGGNQTYSVAAYSDPGIFSVPIEDIHALSHELGEWMDDPFGNNAVPAWGHVGQVSGCQNNLEDGDPVTGNAFNVTLGGFTYHPEDLVFFPWFARITPSTSVNGWYTFLNGFSSPQAVCH